MLSAEECRFFAEAEPWGLILFTRNAVNREQLRRLIDDFRDAVGRPEAPVLIDQEGGRVQRLRRPFAPDYPPAGRIGALFHQDQDQGERAAWLHARAIAGDLRSLGITVNCIPMLDICHQGAHEIVGDRAYSSEVEAIIRLGQASASGLSAGGMVPVAKHIPGHGRARVDSHESLPEVAVSHAELREDFEPFVRLAHLPVAMTAHVLYTALDDARPATLSERVIDDTIRQEIGFDGLLVSDDLSMGALEGGLNARTRAALAAGCDIALHCNGDLREMQDVAAASPPLAERSLERARAALVWPREEPADLPAIRAELAGILDMPELNDFA